MPFNREHPGGRTRNDGSCGERQADPPNSEPRLGLDSVACATTEMSLLQTFHPVSSFFCSSFSVFSLSNESLSSLNFFSSSLCFQLRLSTSSLSLSPVSPLVRNIVPSIAVKLRSSRGVRPRVLSCANVKNE